MTKSVTTLRSASCMAIIGWVCAWLCVYIKLTQLTLCCWGSRIKCSCSWYSKLPKLIHLCVLHKTANNIPAKIAVTASLHVPGCIQHKNCHLFLDSSCTNIVNCSQLRPLWISSRVCSKIHPSWISSIVPSCVLHEYCLWMTPVWISSIVCKCVGVLHPAGSSTLHPVAPCTQDASCINHCTRCVGVLHPTWICPWVHQCSWVYPALIVTCSSLDAQSCIDTAVPDSSCLDSLFCMHVDVIYFSMQYKGRKLLGLLYRKYYQYAEPQILLQLCISLVRPHSVQYGFPT